MSGRPEASKLPSGLQNLKNTGYLNSTLQCLRAIPELQESLNRFTGTDNLTVSLRDLYNNLSQTTEAYAPLLFLQMLRTAFPQFAQRDANGFVQQDAEECWSQIVSSLKQANVPTPNHEESFIDRYMTGEFTSTLKCLDAPQEEEVVIKETFLKLYCHISLSTNYVQDGIMGALDEKIEKNSPTLNEMATYSKTSRISRLPSYLTVQFVRFFWKSQQRVKSKILRKVRFSMELDATELCTDELKNKMAPLRNRLMEKESSKRKAKLAKNKDIANSKNDEIAGIEELKKLINPDLDEDVGANVSGLYELCAVITHSGRTADSGHYIGWVRKENSEDWIKYDDDKVSIVAQKDIQELDGGGDWPIAYILLYRSKKMA